MQAIAGRAVLSPSDLNAYIVCPHLTTLAPEIARGARARPFVADEHAELLRRKGELHERAYLERLRADGRQIVEITLGEPWDFEAAARQTAEAMWAGAEIISQATFVDGRWRGRADFLLKIDRPTELGAWGYEPLDAKLARRAVAPRRPFHGSLYRRRRSNLTSEMTAAGHRIEFAALTVGGGRHTLPACRPILALEVGDGCRRRGLAQAFYRA